MHFCIFFFVVEADQCVGSVYGAFQGYARAFYAELLPPGEEARWYGLFSITDKVSSSFFLSVSTKLTSSSVFGLP